MNSFNQKKTENGAAIVEMLLAFIFILLPLLYGIVEFGLTYYNEQVITNASREGARAGIAHSGESEIIDVVEGYCDDRLIRFDDDIDPVTVVDGVAGAFGEDLTVTVTYNYVFLVPKLLGFGSSLQLKAETIMRMEAPPST